MKNLIKRIGKGVSAAGLVGILACGSMGCGEMSDEQLATASLAGDLLSVHPYASGRERMLGRLIGAKVRQEANRRAMKNTPEEAQIYVNNPRSSQDRPDSQDRPMGQKGEIACFACNSYIDFNGDGDYTADEFVGIKNRFKVNEQVTLVAIISKSDRIAGKFKLFFDDKDSLRLIDEANFEVPEKNRCKRFHYERGLKPGKYIVSWEIPRKSNFYIFEVSE